MKISSILSLLFFPAFVWAQSTVDVVTTTSDSAAPIEDHKPWTVSADAVPVILKGFGVGFGYAVLNNLNASAFYAQETLKSDTETYSFLGTYQAIHRAEIYGARGDFYPGSSVSDGGFYLGVGAAQINLRTKIDPILSDNSITLKKYRLGYQAFLGYDFKGGFLRQISSGIKLGVGYGNGGAFASNLAGTKNEIRDNILLEATGW